MEPTASVSCNATCEYTHEPPAPHHYHARAPASSCAAPDNRARPPSSYRGWRRVVVNFTPSWFSVNMGTGIVSILLHNLPWNAPWLYWVSVAVFGLNVAIFLVFLALSVARYTLFPGLWTAMIRHPVQSLFLGTFPMGLATIVNMVVFVCVPAWGDWAATLAWALWWVDVACALGTNLYLPFIIMFRHQTNLATMTAAWLLPVVSTIVAAATGAIVATVLDDQRAIWTVTISYILWGCGVPLAMCILVIYFQRLTMHSLPPREVIVSVFLPLGPLGQGAFAILQLGQDSLALFERNRYVPAAPAAGQVLYTAGVLVALVLWGFGLVWLFFALASIMRATPRFPFNLGWWGFTFPLGVYSVATTTLAKVLPSLAFKGLGTALSLVVVALWLVVGLGTVRYGLSGKLLHAPCVQEWEAAKREPGASS